VATSSISQTIDSSGTITSSLKLTPSFATSGTVKSVDVKVGDTVRKGQTLAQLDTVALQAAVDSANATLATAQEQLQADETGQTSTGGTGGTGGTGTTGTSGTSAASGTSGGAVTIAYVLELAAVQPSSTSLSALITQIEKAQAAVVAAQQHLDAGQSAVDAAQKTVDADVSQNTTLRDAQKSACDTSSSSSSSPSSSSAPSPSPSADCATAMTNYLASADVLAADMATLDAKIATDDGYTNDLQQAIANLDKLVGQLKSASSSSGGGSAGPGQPSGAPSAPSGGSGQSSTGRSGSGQQSAGGSGSAPSSAPTGGAAGQGGSGQTTPTAQPASAARIAADQAAIDAAQAQVTAAEQNRAAATLKSPAAGKVAAVGLTAGSSATGQTVTIVGTGVQGVNVTVPLAQVDEVKPGQRVSVSADGRTAALHGTVESVGLLSTTSGSTTTFTVAVQLDAGSPQLYDGTGAGVVITTGTATNVITVPNSAIHVGPNGTHTVTAVQGSSTSTVPVTLGIVGDDVTQIKTGLKAGQQVVLADLGQPLPTSSTTSNVGTFRPGQFGGAGGGRGAGG
jgi:HlyD family secretion protein